MKKPTTISKESVSEYREFVQLRLRKRVLEAIEVVLEEEVDQALGCRSYERAEDRRGYRNGAETRRVTMSCELVFDAVEILHAVAAGPPTQ